MLIAAGPERSPTTTSTSGILWTGLKKCIPTTRSGCGVRSPMASTDNDEVLLARTVSAETCSATSAKTACLTGSFSTTASITRSTRPKAA